MYLCKYLPQQLIVNMEIKETLRSGGELVVDCYGWKIRYYFNGPDLRYNGRWVYSNGNIDDWIENFQRYCELKDTFRGQKFCEMGKGDMYITERGVTLLNDFYHLRNSLLPICNQEGLDVLIADYKAAKAKGPRLAIKVARMEDGLPAPTEEEIDEILRFQEEKNNTKTFLGRWKLNKKGNSSLQSLVQTISEYYSWIWNVFAGVGMMLMCLLSILYLAIGCSVADKRSTIGETYLHNDGMKEMGYIVDFFIYVPIALYVIYLVFYLIVDHYKKRRQLKKLLLMSAYTLCNSALLLYAAFSDAHAIKYVEENGEVECTNSVMFWFPTSISKFEVPADMLKAYDLTEFMVYVVLPIGLYYLYSRIHYKNEKL